MATDSFRSASALQALKTCIARSASYTLAFVLMKSLENNPPTQTSPPSNNDSFRSSKRLVDHHRRDGPLFRGSVVKEWESGRRVGEGRERERERERERGRERECESESERDKGRKRQRKRTRERERETEVERAPPESCLACSFPKGPPNTVRCIVFCTLHWHGNASTVFGSRTGTASHSS